jgi:putative transposase
MGKYIKKTPKEKEKLVHESKVSGILETARLHDIHYQTLKNWVDSYAISGLAGLERNKTKVDPELKRLALENEQLKLLVAEKELELRIKNDLLKKTSYQTPIKK